eukprot:6411062-Amphidinium_carterae.1
MSLTNRPLTGFAGSWSSRRARLLTPEIAQDIPLELPVEMQLKAPHEVGPQKQVVEYDEFARCLVSD